MSHWVHAITITHLANVPVSNELFENGMTMPKKAARSKKCPAPKRSRSVQLKGKTDTLAKTPQGRLAETERLRQLKYKYDPLTDRVQRVIRVLDRKNQ
ncbi:MAG TPA: hypothetical protein VGM05_22150 [Planctomycetaceae bacterium]